MCILSFETVSHFVDENKIITNRIGIVWKNWINGKKITEWLMIGTRLLDLIFQNSLWIIHITQIILRISSQFFTSQCENYSMVHLRVNVLIQSFSFQQHVLILICVINVIDDFAFKEWNWFSYSSNRWLILLKFLG